ncbi:elongation factor 1-gamma 2-like [Passer montanus]|uniref:elongation factor 1-gamma 2-like n=1 Tax=Passer montanus TaxID=9160 RepID=UPI00195FF50C|nr:elongation factor 1-gamma 2-like [Passer montanus]
MSCNLITGMFQRLDKLRKNAFASVVLFGKDHDSSISGVWVMRGQELAFTVSKPQKSHNSPQKNPQKISDVVFVGRKTQKSPLKYPKISQNSPKSQGLGDEGAGAFTVSKPQKSHNSPQKIPKKSVGWNLRGENPKNPH